MRIKQSTLAGLKPTKYYVRYVNGVHAMVLLYDIKGQYCVNVITDKNGRTVKQCYPLTKIQYEIYMADTPAKQMKLIAKGGKIYGRSKN